MPFISMTSYISNVVVLSCATACVMYMYKYSVQLRVFPVGKYL